MGDKSEQKREYILEKAHKVFAQKGYRDVTMKDIVEACEISRGGLYLYFSNTRELFDALLHKILNENTYTFMKEGEELSISDILLLFFREQKKQILRKREDIMVATYEYFFAHRPRRGAENKLLNRFKSDWSDLINILEEGVLSGEFYCDDPVAAASNIMFTLEGMKICSRTMGLTEKRVDRELVYIISGLLLVEE